MAELEKTKIVVLEPTTKAVEDLLKAILQKGQAEVERVSSIAEVAQLIGQYQPCMLMTCLTENGQVPDRVNMLKRMENSLKKGLVKVMFTTTLKNAQLGNVISALGVTDFIQEPVPLRTMQFKANLQLKAVETIRKAEERKKAGEEKIVFKKSEAAAKDAAGGGGANAKVKPALQLKEDAFLFKNSGVKKIGKKFVLEMEGPAPETGEWKQHEDKGNAQTSWRWVPKEDENGKPLDDRGDGWVHEGDKPEFKEASGKWQLASEKPELAYRQNGQKIAKKITVDETGEVTVAADSPTAAEAVEKGRAIAKAKREKARTKPEALRTDSARKEKPAPDVSEGGPKEEDAEAKKESPALAMLKRLQQGNKFRKEGTAAEEDAESAAPAEATTVSGEEEEEGAALEKIGREGRPEKKQAALSPLDFLKKKKEANPKADSENSGAAEEEAKGSGDGAPLARLTRGKKKSERDEASSAEEEASAGEEKSARKSLDALARMKARLGASSEDDSAESVADEEISSKEDLSTEEREEGERSGLIGTAGEGKAEKKGAVERAARLKAVKERAEKEGAPAEDAAPPRTRRELLAEIQERINSPLVEELVPEEEARLRKKFGLEDRPEIKPKDLARKERLDAIKKLKDLLEKNAGDPAFEEKALPEAKVHDLSVEEENTRSQSNQREERRESLLRAFDSEDALPEEEEGSAPLGKKRREESRGDKPDLYADEANYLPVAALTPPGLAWEATGEHYIYLASEVRYRGFEKLEALLPLWIFGGEKVPELLDKSQQWRFYGPLPTLAKTLDEIPRLVRDWLLALRDQVKKDLPETPALAAERAALAAIEAEEEKRAELEAEAKLKPKPPSQADGLEELFEKKKSSSSSAQATLDSLKNRLGEDAEETGGDLSAHQDARESEELSTGASESETSAKKRRADDGATPDEEASAAEGGGGSDLQSRLDSLKNRLGDSDAGDQDTRDSAAAAAELGLESAGEESEAPRRQESSGFEEAEKKPGAKTNGYAEQSLDKLKASPSPAFEKFLERRKAKQAAADAGAAGSNPSAGNPSSPAGRPPAYLGVYVALSNSFGATQHWQKAVVRVLKSMALSFGSCEVALLRQSAPDEEGYYLVDQVSGTGLEAGSRVRAEEGFLAPVTSAEAGSDGQILGYLFLQATEGRAEFSAAETGAATKAALLLWPVLKQAAGDAGEEKAA